MKNISLIAILIIISVSFSYAQFKPDIEMTPDEESIFKESLESFYAMEYTKSLEGFSQMLSLYPREPVFNFIYGASMIELNTDLRKAFDYLEFAAGKGIGEANFYIGLGYHLLYDFNNALHFYQEFKNTVKEKYWKEYEIEKHIQQSTNGKDLINYAYDIQVISDKQTSFKNFYYAYNLDNFGGELIVKTDVFKGKADKKFDKTDLMYISNNNDILLLSSYGDSRKNSLDLYIAYKTGSIWSKPQKLSDIINTPFDEAFPFLSEDGTTLYFSSKGHNSIGGYDIFKSYYNSTKNEWSKPENMDFPINTPFDDIMFAPDRYNETAFFASTRNSNSEKIGVYQILLNKNPLTRQLVDVNEIYQHAKLESNPDAIAELIKRQEIRANSSIDSTKIRNEIIAQNDTTNIVDNLINDSYLLLESKKSDANEFLEYAAAAYEICELNISEIEKINKKLHNLRNKTDLESTHIKDSLNKLLNKKSILVSEMYDLSKFLQSNGSQINNLSKYYLDELNLLNEISPNDARIKEKAETLFTEIQNINTKNPLNRYTNNIVEEISSKNQSLNTYKNSLNNELSSLEKLNEKIEVKLGLAKNEEELEIREKYIYDIKTYENQKIDIISKIKEIEVQIEFLNYEINQLNLRKSLVQNSQNKLDESLFFNPELNISNLNNDVELLKTHISQNSLRELSYKQDEILSNQKYYSKEIDFDAILYAGPDITKIGLEEIMVDTKSYTDKYQDILSDNALKTGDLVFKNDSIKEHIIYLETEFDNTTSSSEKQQIISEINLLTSKIAENNEQITKYLNSQPKVNVNIYITEFNDIKNNLSTNQTNPIIKETESLILESMNLNNDIDDLKILGSNKEIPPILYLEGMKSEIDNLIITKIETLKASAIIVDNQQSQENILLDIKKEISHVNITDNSNTLKQITNSFNEIETLYKDAEKEKNTTRKNEILVDANKKLDITINNNISFLNSQLIKEYEHFNTYQKGFNKLEELPEYTIDYINKIDLLQTEATNLQLNAEENPDKLKKMQFLSQAWDKLQSANKYYNYLLEISIDESKYKNNFEIKADKTIDNFIAAGNNIQIIEPESLTNNTDFIADNNSENSTENITENNTENITEIITENITENITKNDINLDETINKLNDVNYDGKILVNISSQAQINEEISNLSNDINELQNKLANTSNKNKKEQLNSDIRLKEEEQIDAIIKYSITGNEILAELDTLSQLNKDYNKDLIRDLCNNQTELRSSIIDYSNFYTSEEIMDKHIAANEIEKELINLYNNLVYSTDNQVLENNINKIETISNTNIITDNSNKIEPIDSLIGNYEYKYPYDEETELKIEKIETEINSLELEINDQQTYISELEASMTSINDLKKYQKIQKQLKKQNKIYLKQLKSWAELNKNYISLQYNFGDTHYFDLQSVNKDITTVCDSLKSKADNQLDESMALFEVIISSNAKTANNSIIETYKKASALSIEGINLMNTANSLKTSGDLSNPIVLYHYRSVETSSKDDTDTNNSENIDTNLISENNIIDENLNDTVKNSNNDTENIGTNTINNLESNITETNTSNNNINNNTVTNNTAENMFGNIIDPNSKSFYSDTNPINEIPNTEGLFYRIQIAAFNGKVANDRFIGIKPVFWEAIPNSNLVRYIIGNFLKLNNARTNLPTVQAMGYTDAFIVAYYNGNRIPIYEARQIEERELLNQNENNIIAENNTENSNDIINPYNANNNVVENTKNIETDDITQTSGVFFCVQIGVYATKLGPDRMYGLSPLMYHNYRENLIRHTFGKYYDFNTAINEQNKIRRIGITDAFVVAYHNGEKITINQARDLLANINPPSEEILVNIPENQIPINVPVDNTQIDINQQEENTLEEKAPAPIVEYYIQIGVFRKDVNTYIRSSFRRIAGNNQLVRLTNNEMTLYRIGIFNSYQDAQNTLNGVISSGIKDAFIVSFINGKKVNIAQARAIE